MKRSLALLAAFVIASVHQTLSGETLGDWTYSVTDNQATITGYLGDDTEVVIPAELDGMAVVKVGDEAFKDNTSVTSITIPDSVTSIGDFAFFSCTSLTNVTIGNSVTSIGHSAFYNCGFLSITIPDSVTSIGEDAFDGCTSLTTVTLPVRFRDSYQFIGFSSDQALLYFGSAGDWTYTVTDNQATITGYSGAGGAVEIPAELDGVAVVNVKNRCFDNNTSVTSITIPDSVTSIGEEAFFQATSLTSITVDADNLNYSSVDGVLFNKLQTLLIQYPEGGSDTYTIPNSVTSIGVQAFRSCYNLTSITIPNSVTSIGHGAFHDCTSLTSVTIPDSVTSIGSDAFSKCYDLTSVTIGNSVTSIGAYAFYSCFNLTSVTLPATLFMEENYSSYSLSADQVRVEKTAIDTFVVTAETAARTAGQTDVTSDPATYSLFTAADVTGAETAARTLGQQDVVNAPSSFDLYTASDLVVPKFLNLSNRAYVGIGDEILIGSMIILDKPMRILVRVAGPSLANGADPVPNPLLDPTVQLVRLSDGPTIKTNDNWEDDLEQKTLIESTGIPPSDSRESAMVTTVDPGTYSFVVRGVGDTTGFAGLDIYEFDE